MPLPIPELPSWEYCHPLAIIYYLCTICFAFGGIMADSGFMGRPLRLVIYIDEICPGNPLRPEKSRTLQAVYWAFADWPQHVLQRTAVWPVFGTIRSTIVDKLPGRVSDLMRRILHVFFATVGPSFARGVTIVKSGGETLIRTAIFSGFLADEKAHNQITGSKGASGTRPCPTCTNVFGRMNPSRVPRGCVHYKSTDPSQFVPHTSDSIHLAYDTVCAAPVVERQRISQMLGLNMNEHGLLHDQTMRQIYRPADHMLRDHQHVLTSDGVANKQVAHLMRALIKAKIPIDTVATYIADVNLPHCHGRTDKHWVSKKRLGAKMESLSSFSGIVLSLIPILVMFMTEVVLDTVAVDDPLRQHAECLVTLWHIMGVCMLGAVDAMEHIGLLRKVIARHSVQFAALYPGAQTPKFHQLFHIPDNAVFLGRLLSCFVLERKHRTTKRAALFVFRYIESTVIKDLVNQQCEAVCGRTGSLFDKKFIVTPRRFQVPGSGVSLSYSRQAVLPCGSVRAGDIVCLVGGEVGEVVAFWTCAGNATIVVRVLLFELVNPATCQWLVSDPVSRVVDSEDILAPVQWRRIRDGVIRIVPAFRTLLKDLIE